jgi:hypothetical protein
MNPTDKWLLLLNFYLITASAGELTLDDFDAERLAAAYRENPGEGPKTMEASARKLVLEFQAQTQDTELKNEVARRGHSPLPQSRRGDEVAQRGQKEIPFNGPLPISVPDLPGNV